MGRTPSRIFDRSAPAKKAKKLQLWELVDRDGNRLVDEPCKAKTAGEAALYLIRVAGGWDVRKVEDDPA